MPQQPFILDLCNYFSLTCDTFSLLGQLTSIENLFKANKKVLQIASINVFLMSIFFTLSWYFAICIVPAVIYTLKVNNEDTRRMCEICLKLAIKTLVVLVSLLLILNSFQTLLWCFHC